MATVGPVNTTIVKFWTGASPVAITCTVDANMSFTTEFRDVTCKDSGDYTEELPGRLGWEGGGAANFAFDAANGFSQLFTSWKAKEKIKIAIGTNVSGDFKVGGDAYIANLDWQNSGTNENSTFNFSFRGVGEPLKTVNP